MANELDFPTILIADEDDGVRSTLMRELQHEGYFVLVARDGGEALEVVRTHSRPIHLMITPDNMDGRTLAGTLKHYRPNMRVLFLTHYVREGEQDLSRPGAAVTKVRELLKPPGGEPMQEVRPHSPGKAISHRAC